jgi:hypothetical protein
LKLPEIKRKGFIFIKKIGLPVGIYTSFYFLLFFVLRLILIKEGDLEYLSTNDLVFILSFIFLVPFVSSIISTLLLEKILKNGVSLNSVFFTTFAGLLFFPFVLIIFILFLLLVFSVLEFTPFAHIYSLFGFLFTYVFYNFLLYFLSLKMHRNFYSVFKEKKHQDNK